jgi:tRNA (mo5U34)-methyltransferase
MVSLDLAELTRRADDFARRLEEIQRGIPADFTWYPHDTIGGLCTLEQLLPAGRRDLASLVGGDPVLDVGCGDGRLAFFLESLGCRVVAIDNPETNANEMRGVRALGRALGSSVEICEQNIDGGFWPPGDDYFGVAFLFGVLYHLKNPYQVLENLARRARHVILSTRIARFDPTRTADIGRLPVAWLLEDSEISGDATNYWIFTEAGVRRLLHRTGWDVLDALTTGNTEASDPVTGEGDARFFCLARRRNRLTNGELLAGWHAPEGFTDWRWTERRFAAAFRATPGREARLTLRFLYPEAMRGKLGPLTVSATANGAPLPPRTYAGAGDHAYRATVACDGERVTVEFALDRWWPPGEIDLRERGVVVSSVELR